VVKLGINWVSNGVNGIFCKFFLVGPSIIFGLEIPSEFLLCWLIQGGLKGFSKRPRNFGITLSKTIWDYLVSNQLGKEVLMG